MFAAALGLFLVITSFLERVEAWRLGYGIHKQKHRNAIMKQSAVVCTMHCVLALHCTVARGALGSRIAAARALQSGARLPEAAAACVRVRCSSIAPGCLAPQPSAAPVAAPRLRLALTAAGHALGSSLAPRTPPPAWHPASRRANCYDGHPLYAFPPLATIRLIDAARSAAGSADLLRSMGESVHCDARQVRYRRPLHRSAGMAAWPLRRPRAVRLAACRRQREHARAALHGAGHGEHVDAGRVSARDLAGQRR